MDKAQQGSFLCFNCGEKNYFDKKKYAGAGRKNKGITGKGSIN